MRPYRDDLNKRAYVVWHELPDDLVVRAQPFYRDVLLLTIGARAIGDE